MLLPYLAGRIFCVLILLVLVGGRGTLEHLTAVVFSSGIWVAAASRRLLAIGNSYHADEEPNHCRGRDFWRLFASVGSRVG